MPDLAGSRIDHLNLSGPDLERSVAFYSPVLEVLGVSTLLAVPADPEHDQLAVHGYGVGARPFFWLVEKGRMGENVHLAFTSDDRAGVHACWEAALAAGATPQLPPAVHEEYHPDYYGALVLDPDGVRLEAVCHAIARRALDPHQAGICQTTIRARSAASRPASPPRAS